MLFLKSIYCRIFQNVFRVILPLLPYRQPQIINSCERIDNIVLKENITSVLIITDKGIVNNNLLTPVTNALKSACVDFAIYDKTQPNPTIANVEDALSVYKAHNCKGIITIGGGSSMDCAKAVGARVAYPEKSIEKLKGMLRVLRATPIIIAIPTTAGTGSETTLAAVITDSVNHHKYALMSFPLIPRYAVLDPALTYTLPAHLTATTGMDALTHAVEAYIGKSTTKETRKLCLEATKLIFENITEAYNDGKNKCARENMLLASFKAGAAFTQSYVGYIHAIAHSLGGQYNMPHGLANAVIMPYVLKSYGKSAHKKLLELGIAAGVCTSSDTIEKGAEKFISAIEKLNRQMDIPKKLKGIKEEDIPLMASYAEKEANPLYPVPKLMTKKELEVLYYEIADWED
ncbi:MAG: iron-containing alcohol dehydrogenase [Ruminococcaceae bacterium]|nr:iron-containing alcohol dehydrogenase [Oscillospiraceae bacterium]